jgi:uncharacterized membrane protein YuzA (DUF378 family)
MLKQACWFCKIVGAIAIIGALNWGLVGLAEFNLVDHLFGAGSVASRVIYSIVGLSGLALLASYFMVCPFCRRDFPEGRRDFPEDRK